MSKNTDIFQLIQGTFSDEDAKEILSHLFAEKIKFHVNRNFSLKERFGEESAYSTKRIKELKHDRTELLNIIENARIMGKKLKLSSQVHIELVDDEKTTPRIEKDALLLKG